MKLGKLAAVSSVLLGAVMFPHSSFAQRSTPDRLKAVPTDSPVNLDGVLDEDAWAKSPRISNFTQRELEENKPATEKTG
jgi:hypothetical protein